MLVCYLVPQQLGHTKIADSKLFDELVWARGREVRHIVLICGVAITENVRI
jgi:hypothetical protein